MKTFLYGSLVVLAYGAGSLALASEEERNPVGETANFIVDTTSGRTTGLVKNGTLTTSITDHTDDFKLNIDYDFNISFLGRKTGTELVGVPGDYYTAEFWTKFRQTKHFESPEFKVDWLATEDATTMFGGSYPSCDKVHIYDIQLNSAFARILRAMFAVPESGSLQDMELTADIYHGEPAVPALGAVKIDGTAKYSGMSMKFGADYQP